MLQVDNLQVQEVSSNSSLESQVKEEREEKIDHSSTVPDKKHKIHYESSDSETDDRFKKQKVGRKSETSLVQPAVSICKDQNSSLSEMDIDSGSDQKIEPITSPTQQINSYPFSGKLKDGQFMATDEIVHILHQAQVPSNTEIPKGVKNQQWFTFNMEKNTSRKLKGERNRFPDNSGISFDRNANPKDYYVIQEDKSLRNVKKKADGSFEFYNKETVNPPEDKLIRLARVYSYFYKDKSDFEKVKKKINYKEVDGMRVKIKANYQRRITYLTDGPNENTWTSTESKKIGIVEYIGEYTESRTFNKNPRLQYSIVDPDNCPSNLKYVQNSICNERKRPILTDEMNIKSESDSIQYLQSTHKGQGFLQCIVQTSDKSMPILICYREHMLLDIKKILPKKRK